MGNRIFDLMIRTTELDTDINLSEKVKEDLLQMGEDAVSFINNSMEGIVLFEWNPPISLKAPADERYLQFINGVIIAGNASAARLFGFKEGEVPVGIQVKEFINTEDHYIKRALQSIVKSGYNVADIEISAKILTGDTRYFLTSMVGIVKEGKVVRAWNTLRDITEKKEMEKKLRRALAELKKLKNRIETESSFLQEEIKYYQNFEDIIGQSEALMHVLYRIEQVAPTNATVLIQGETGTGKELVARAIHFLGNRKDRPLLKVSCANFSPQLMDSELFGHEKGSFTGAEKTNPGRFEIADGSTIFLDEIGEMPLDLQSKLLRVLQDREIERIGSTRTIKVDVRVLAATNRDLAKEVREGRFREDLFYRLNVFPITVPPLRERRDDIPILAQHYLSYYNKKIGKHVDKILPETMQAFMGYSWPGNVREIMNVIEQAVITSHGSALQVDFLKSTGKNVSGSRHLEDIERDHILKTLKQVAWQIKGSKGGAALLGINPSTLRSRMKKLGIKRPDKNT